MHRERLVRCAVLVASVAAAAWAPFAVAQAPAAEPVSIGTPFAAAPPSVTPLAFRSNARTLDDYKKHAAGHIVAFSSEELAKSLTPILKSVVVLDITVDAEGNVTRLALWRSNGYEDAEKLALDSVKRAGKLPAPSPEILKGQATVRFLETWLFRPDNRYHVRSAMPADFPVDEIRDVARGKKPAKPS